MSGFSLAYVRKAITGAVAAAAAAIVSANVDGTITNDEWKAALAAFVAGGVAVYYVPNRKDNRND